MIITDSMLPNFLLTLLNISDLIVDTRVPKVEELRLEIEKSLKEINKLYKEQEAR